MVTCFGVLLFCMHLKCCHCLQHIYMCWINALVELCIELLESAMQQMRTYLGLSSVSDLIEVRKRNFMDRLTDSGNYGALY